MSLGITAAQLERMRTQAESLMPDTAIIQAVTRTSDGAGGWTESWAAVTGGTVICRIDPVSLQVISGLFGQQEALVARYRGTFPHDAPLAEDRQVVTGGRTYQIVQMDVDHSDRVSRRAILSEVRD